MSGKSEDVKVDVSKEEVAAAKAEIDAEEAEFDDAESPHTGDFEVTKEEMSIIRAELACEFPDDYTYLRWEYIVIYDILFYRYLYVEGGALLC